MLPLHSHYHYLYLDDQYLLLRLPASSHTHLTFILFILLIPARMTPDPFQIKYNQAQIFETKQYIFNSSSIVLRVKLKFLSIANKAPCDLVVPFHYLYLIPL